MARLRYNNSVGTLGASLTNSGTTITFASAPSFATIISPDFIPIVLEPTGTSPSANFEIVYLTAYTAGATTGTIVRGQEGTTGVAHSNGVAWAGGPVLLDALPQTSNYALFTSSGTWDIPPGVTNALMCVRGGGGGGGGGSSNSSSNGFPGTGGTAAGVGLGMVTFAGDTSLTITIGAGGSSGTGGASGGNAGTGGGNGGDTKCTGTQSSTVYGFQAGGGGSPGATTTAAGGQSDLWGSVAGEMTSSNGSGFTQPGSGSASGTHPVFPMILVVGGTQGATNSGATGGAGGSAAQGGTVPSLIAYSGTGGGAASGANGGAGQNATLPGCGGGGGGAAATGGSGGNGGTGAPGGVEIWW